MDQCKNRPPKGCAKADEAGDVDHVGRKQTPNERPQGHTAHPRHLRRVDAQAGYQASREDGTPTTAREKAGRAFERSARVQRLAHLHQPLPAEQTCCLPADQGTNGDADGYRANQHERIDSSAGNRNASDGEDQVARCKRQRYTGFLDEHQDADHDDQGRAVETLNPGNRVHPPIFRAKVRSMSLNSPSTRAKPASGISLWMIRTFSPLHTLMYRRGMARKMGQMQTVLLTTTGRKSGQPHTVPVGAVREGDGWVVIASNNGAKVNPGWWLNMLANPNVILQVNDEATKARMKEFNNPAA